MLFGVDVDGKFVGYPPEFPGLSRKFQRAKKQSHGTRGWRGRTKGRRRDSEGVKVLTKPSWEMVAVAAELDDPYAPYNVFGFEPEPTVVEDNGTEAEAEQALVEVEQALKDYSDSVRGPGSRDQLAA